MKCLCNLVQTKMTEIVESHFPIYQFTTDFVHTNAEKYDVNYSFVTFHKTTTNLCTYINTKHK